MGRHVVVSFDNTAEAEEFVAAAGKAGAVFFMGTDGHFRNIDVDATEVRGLFGKPDKFCDCPYKEDDAFVRGEKFGWVVHTACKRPRGGHLQSSVKNLLYAANMSAINRVKQEHYVGLTAREGKERWPEPKG